MKSYFVCYDKYQVAMHSIIAMRRYMFIEASSLGDAMKKFRDMKIGNCVFILPVGYQHEQKETIDRDHLVLQDNANNAVYKLNEEGEKVV